jgi:Uri superfamily endonuclease
LAGKICDKSGVYALVLHVATDCRIKVGKLGTYHFRRGFYIYVGSAHGPGGLKARIKHHAGKSMRPHWHLDYLRPMAELKEVWYAETKNRLEHHWATAVAKMSGSELPVKGFGSSDCRCISHLFYVPTQPKIGNFTDKLRKSTKSDKSYRIYSFSDFLSAI